MAHPVVHWELSSKNSEKLQQFYTSLFDWHVEQQKSMDYGAVRTGGKDGIDGGIFQDVNIDPPYVTFYVQADDLHASLGKAQSLGARTVVPPTPIPEAGTFTQIADPDGHLIGIIQPSAASEESRGGQPRDAGDGHPVVHWEIGSRDAERLQQFYTDLFGWQVDFNNPMNYGTVTTGGKGGINGGIFQAANGTPSYLTIYVQVDAVKTALAKAENLGAKTIVPPTPIPGVGVFAHFADLDGHVIGVIQDEMA